MDLQTLSTVLRKARAVNQTSNGYVAKAPVAFASLTDGDAATATGASVLNLVSGGGTLVQNAVLVIPYGTGSADQTFSMRVIGWRSFSTQDTPQTGLWIPLILAELACTLGTAAGVAGMALTDSALFTDAITLTTGNANVSTDITTVGANTIAHCLIDLKGMQKLEFSFTTGGSATDCNCLFAML